MRHALCAAALFAAGLALPAIAEPVAHAILQDADGRPVGQVTLIQSPNGGVLFQVEASGLQPGGHGFHVHEFGRCEPTFEAAGGHYNPEGLAHGFLASDGYHAGDLPNVFADAGGVVRTDAYSQRLSLLPGAQNTVFDADGSAIIVHDYLDSYGDQPTALGRVACGVVVPGMP